MADERSEEAGMKPNRFGLAAIVAAGIGVGVFPYLLFIPDRAYFVLPIVVVGSALVAFSVLGTIQTRVTEEPSLGEWLLASWSAVAYGSQIAGAGMILYGVWYLLVYLGGYLARLTGADVHPPAAEWASWVSLMGGALLAVAPVESAKGLVASLYPSAAGSRSAFFPLLSKRWGIGLAVLGVVAGLAIMAVLLDPRGKAFAVGLLLLLFYSSFPLTELRVRQAGLDAEAVESISRVLERSGYSVMRSPRTGRPEIDPLIDDVDLLVEGDERAFALEIKSSAADALVEWNAAAGLKTAASVLEAELTQGSRLSIRPVLVVVGGRIAPSLSHFSEQESVPVIHLARSTSLEADVEEVAKGLQAIGTATASGRPAPSGS
jgi:hypothetical protein